MTAAAKKRSRAEDLAITSMIAPRLRDQADVAAGRRVALTDANGNVVGYRTLLDVQKSLMRRHALEIELQPGEKPKEVPCRMCGRPARVARVGRTVEVCSLCKRVKCARCDAPLSKGSTSPSRNARLAGKPRHCAKCKTDVASERVRCSMCNTELSQKSTWRWRSELRTNPAAVVRCRPCSDKAIRVTQSESATQGKP